MPADVITRVAPAPGATRDRRATPAEERKCRTKAFWGAITIVRSWQHATGVPSRVAFPLPQLAHFRGRLSDSSVWPSLVGLQHNEKDVFRVLGPGGLPDWGDGECQRLQAELSAAGEALSRLAASCTRSPRRWSRTRPCTRRCASTSPRTCPPSTSTRSRPSRTLERESKAAKLVVKLGKLAAGELNELERLGKHIAFLNAQVSECRMHAAAADSLLVSVAALPATPTLAETAAALAAWLVELRSLVDKFFALGTLPPPRPLRSACVASSSRACASPSVRTSVRTMVRTHDDDRIAIRKTETAWRRGVL